MIAATGYHHLRSSICWMRKKYKNKGRRQEKKSKKAEQCSETLMQEIPPLMMHPKKHPISTQLLHGNGSVFVTSSKSCPMALAI